jgi:Uma2 family endonuclease
VRVAAVETTKTIITEADLFRLAANDRRFEIVNGEVVDMHPVGLRHSVVAGNIHDILKAYARQHKLGSVHMDSLIYVLQERSETGIRKTRVPDTSFIRKGRLPRDFDRSRPFPGAPDLAVEVVSPDEGADELMAKMKDYFEAGTEQVWVLFPEYNQLYQYIGEPSNVTGYTDRDTLDAGALFPGLTIAVSELFAEHEDEL